MNKEMLIAILSVAGIGFYLLVRFIFHWPLPMANISLYLVLLVGGLPLIRDLSIRVWQRKFGSDLLAGVSIITSVILQEYLAGAIVVLMLSGGEALENFSLRRASRVLEKLAKRMPTRAHRKENGKIADISIEDIRIGDECVIFPHELCPVDGLVIEGHSTMDESYLTGEPFLIPKTTGAKVISGAINGEDSLTIRATVPAKDSRYAKIMKVMQESQQSRPQLRRLGDMLGAWYTPLALAIAAGAWIVSGDSHRFLATIIIATPCPLLIAIPVAIIGAISLSAQRGIIIKDPAVLEQIDQCRILILDKTGTLTYGKPLLTDVVCFNNFDSIKVLQYAASIERYSKHPLAPAIVESAHNDRIDLLEAREISEPPGKGLSGTVGGKRIFVTGRNAWLKAHPADGPLLPAFVSGLECLITVDGQLAALLRFHDKPRREGRSFIQHLRPRHRFNEVLIVSGDRQEEVRYLADQMGIQEIHAGQSPEAKVGIVKLKNQKAKTIFIGDGINDAPALLTATVGIAFGPNSDITSEAAGVVIMESSLQKVDEFFHISTQMRRIALQSAVGGMALSTIGMFLAAGGLISPVAGAITQEVIDLLAVLNALRITFIDKKLSDF